MNQRTIPLTQLPLELRVEECASKPPLSIDEAKAIADHVYETQGSLCAACHDAARVRIISVLEPDKPRCHGCHDRALVEYGFNSTRG